MVKKPRRGAKGSPPAPAALIVLLVSLSGAAGAQDAAVGGSNTSAGGLPAPSAAPEAPSSLFSATLGDADSELLVKGSWEMALASESDLAFPASGGLVFAVPEPLLFTQRPDLFIQFLLYKRIFFEARVSDDIAQARYALGYRGGEGELLKEFRLGNDGISFPQLPFLSFGLGSYRSFGASAIIGTDSFTGNAMIRYDQADRVVKRFMGSREIVDSTLQANAFISGRWFTTVNQGFANLQVFVQSAGGSYSDGSGNKYRKLDSGEYSWSSTEGTISLASAATTRVLAFYTGGGGSGTNFADRVNITAIGFCDLLYDPDYRDGSGNLDPKLQILNRYPTLATASSSEAFVRDRASGLRDAVNYSARIDGSGYIEVTYQANSTPGSLDYSHPFDNAMAWLYTRDFSGNGPTDYAPSFSHELVVRSYGTADYIGIDKDFIPGSVEVRRNGVQEFDFTIDPEEGRLSLASPPGLSDEMEVSYLRQTAERRSGSIAAGLAGAWSLGEEERLWAALGLRWSVPGTSYSTGGSTNPGSVSLTAGEKDATGPLKHQLAAAASYSQDDAAGRYRIEGMESDFSVSCTFYPDLTTLPAGATAKEIVESGYSSGFPALYLALHGDGSTQKALQIAIGSTLGTVSLRKIIPTPPFSSFKTLSFMARRSTAIDPGSSLSIALDDGSTAFISVDLPGSALGQAWKRFSVRYGYGNFGTLYAQASESGPLLAVGGATVTVNIGQTAASRLAISYAANAADETVWVDEVLLEDSSSRLSASFQGSFSWKDPVFKLGSDTFPILSNVEFRADASGGASDVAFASGSASLSGQLGPAALALRLRGNASTGTGPGLGGGHSILFPAFPFPLVAGDKYDYDPATGAFGREDKLSLTAGGILGMEAGLKAAWTPSGIGAGLFTQTWSGKLALGGEFLTLTAGAVNRARPGSAPIASGTDYWTAWTRGFADLLPRFESSSELRQENLGLALRLPKGGEFASAMVTASAEPFSNLSGTTGIHHNLATARLAAPISLWGIKLAPYYKRSWSDLRGGAGSGLLSDVETAIGDLSGLELLYAGIPFAELWDPALPTRFADESPAAIGLTTGSSYKAEMGITADRDFGSYWYDLILPSSLSLAFRRELSRTEATTLDAAVVELNAKAAAVNLFGALGAYPLGTLFDSDEYLSSLQVTLKSIVGESLPRVSGTARQLATLYAGVADSLELENSLTVATDPSTSAWSEDLRVSLSKRESRHWLLDLYRLAKGSLGRPATQADASGGGTVDAGSGETGKSGRFISLYLQDLAAREPVMRSSFEVKLGLSGKSADSAGSYGSWSLSESYVGKLTVPERLTASVSGGFKQARDGSSGLLLFGLLLGVEMTISF